MKSLLGWPAVLLLCAACASEDPAPGFFMGGLDAQVQPRSDASTLPAPLVDAARDGSMAMEAAVLPSEPGAEVGRLAGFTAAHNAARARVQTSPALPPLSWSNEIALVAQAYAEKLAAGCLDTLAHSEPEQRNHWGENLASYGITGGTGLEPNGSAEGTVQLWESELACYSYGLFATGTNATCTDACARYGGCGHYTQLVWRDTERVGCGVADCSAGGWRKSYWVCNYDPTGNYRGEFPY
jgi:pathogenesis-related protein 1